MSLFKKLFPANRPSEPASYQTQFSDALKRTKRLGLELPDFTPTPKRYLSGENAADIGRCWIDTFPNERPEAFSGRCFQATGAIQAPLEDLLGIPLYFTLEYVQFEGRPVFHTPTDKLKPMLKQNLSFQPVNLHAWLTLPSHEIIDLTFLTTVGVVNNVPDFIGRACVSHPDDLPEAIIYHPQLVGGDFLKKTGVLLEARVFL